MQDRDETPRHDPEQNPGTRAMPPGEQDLPAADPPTGWETAAPPGHSPAPAPPASSSGPRRARIAGVEAGVAAGLFPSTASPSGGSGDEQEPRPDTVLLPDWTDPPTREVPRVLRDHLEDPSTAERSVPGPVWREVESDWEEDDLFADLVEEAHTRADQLDVDPWLVPPSRPAAGLVPPASDATVAFEPTSENRGGGEPGAAHDAPEQPEATDGEAPARSFEESAGGLRARVAWAGRASHRRKPHRTTSSTASGNGEAAAAARSEEAAEPVMKAEGAATAPWDEGPPVGETERSGRGRRSPIVATAVGLVLGGLVLLCFLAGPPATLALISVVMLLAMAEGYQSLRRANYRPATLLGLVAAPGAAIAGYFKGPEGLVFVAALFVGATFLWYLLAPARRHPVANISATFMAWCWIGLLGSFAGLLVSPSMFPDRTGVAYLLGALEVAVAYDVAAYAVGSLFGRHTLAPAISPHKTWEGLIGGCTAAILVALVVTSQMHPWTLQRAAALGVVAAVVAPLGDLAESLVKRDLRVKDMGSLLPSHGGALDRVDAILFVLPATYFLVRLFHG